MRRRFKDLAIYDYNIAAEFPVPGKEGYLYRALVTNRIYLYVNNEYIPLNDGHDSPYRGAYDTLEELEAAYPTDVTGAYATVGDALYIYNGGWNLSGILYRGSFANLAALQAAYPTDVRGAQALVAGVLYVYDGGWIPGAFGSGLSWSTYFHELTNEDITNKYFDLSENIHSVLKDKTILAVETDIQAPTEYEVIVDSEDRLRRISWAGRGLETDPPMQAGWRCWVWYPVQ